LIGQRVSYASASTVYAADGRTVGVAERSGFVGAAELGAASPFPGLHAAAISAVSDASRRRRIEPAYPAPVAASASGASQIGPRQSELSSTGFAARGS
jgi:hypothetical protein